MRYLILHTPHNKSYLCLSHDVVACIVCLPTFLLPPNNNYCFLFHFLTMHQVTLYCLANSVGMMPFLLKTLVQSCFPVPPPRIVAKNDDPIRVFLLHPDSPAIPLPFPISRSVSMPFHPSVPRNSPLCKYSDRLPPETYSCTLQALTR